MMDLENFKNSVLPLRDKLYRFAFRFVGDVAEAEDVVQEVFIKLWDKRQYMEQVNNLEAWCMQATRNLSIDKLRSKHKRLLPIPNGFDLNSPAATPDQLAEGRDAIRHIKNLMAQLPEKQRMVMQCRDIEGMSYQEIADVLQIPVNQVKVNLFRARKAIRTQLINTGSYGL